MGLKVMLFTNAVNMAMEFSRRNNLTVSLTGGVMREEHGSLSLVQELSNQRRRSIAIGCFLG